MKNTVNINIICDENIIVSRLKYTLDFISNHPLNNKKVHFALNKNIENSSVIYYSKEKRNGTYIPAQSLFFTGKNVKFKYFFLNKYDFNNTVIYSVEKYKKENTVFYSNDSFGFDILESIFFHISRYEEVYSDDSTWDRHKRMKTSEQILYKNKLHHIPVVDILLVSFLKALDITITDIDTTYSLTHDIDIIRKYNSLFKSTKSLINAFRLGLGIKGFLKIAKSIKNSIKNPKNDPYYTYEWLFEPSMKYKRKIVFFMTGGGTRWDPFNQSYYNELPEIIDMAKEKNYEIGLHPAYLSYNNEKRLKQEYEKLRRILNEDIKYVRTHYLRLDIQKSFVLFEKMKFEYDSTLGFADDIGFRCGTGFEYQPYNFVEERAWYFKEIPLVVMDSSLFFNVCNADVNCFKEKLFAFLDRNKYNTHITFNFHNATFDNSVLFTKGLKEIYTTYIK